MSSIVQVQPRPSQRSALIWFLPIQAAAAFTVIAISSGGQMLRTWIVGALTWTMALPLLVSIEAGLTAMMLFEPVRGLIRRAQYLFVDYTSQDPVHVLTPIVTLLAFAVLLKRERLAILHASPLAAAVSALGLIYFLEMFNPLQGGLIVGLSGGMFVLIPMLWFYFGQALKENFLYNGLRLIVVLGLLTSLYGVFQLVFGYPGFEQIWIEKTDFYNSIAVGHIERALATFCSAEEWGRYTEIGAIIAFGFALAKKRLAIRGVWLAAGAFLTGFVILTGQRSAVFGLVVGVVVLVLLGARSFPNALARLAMLMAPVLLLVVFMQAPAEEEMWSHDETQTVSTLVSHTQRGVLKPAEEQSFQIRLTNWTYLLTDVIPYRPLGAGVGAGTLSEWRFNQESDLPPIDSSILVHAISCGIPGILLFIWILGRSTWMSCRLARRAASSDENADVKRIVAAVMFAIVLNSMFGLTFTLYSIAPIAWLLIGWLSAETLRARNDVEREIITI
jgi:O-antigen ligase/polysaccharide polymerase Wzy-like membrane protein